ncbi:hypothetical protein [Nitrosomonas communis]|uniref:hypothetical protein n=1 Tax=Nitrosomonas communis TaxID=44574 RepID=UPI0015A72393|nr:hypothetical protein [Nitrosomonas communis]
MFSLQPPFSSAKLCASSMMAGEMVIGKQFFNGLDQMLNAIDFDTNQMMSLLIPFPNQN